VILLKRSNEWNLSPAKEGFSRKMGREKEKKRKQGLKSKRGETSCEEAPCFKRRKEKKEDKIYRLLGEILSKERKKERRSHFPIVQNQMCGLIHTSTSFAFALPSIPLLFPFLPSFTKPFSISHDYLPHKLSRIFLCFYNIQGVV
jgi:hypothetical protein